MNYDIIIGWRSIQITTESLEYTFNKKLFSHSSVLLDGKENIIATGKRKNRKQMDFELLVGGDQYHLSQTPSETRLTLKGSDLGFNTQGGFNFFKQSVAVTQLKSNDHSLKKFSLEINDAEHEIALLFASCLECYSSKVSG